MMNINLDWIGSNRDRQSALAGCFDCDCPTPTGADASEGSTDQRFALYHWTRVMSLGAMTASIAHEINQPLMAAAINSSICLRLLEADPPDIEGAREIARRTQRDTRRATDIITCLRGHFSKKPLQAEAIDLNEAAREVIALVIGDFRRKGIVVRTEFEDSLPVVSGDRVQLQQVMLNLLQNASDALHSTDCGAKQIVVTTESHSYDGVRFSVCDSGAGLDPSCIDKLFQPFCTTKSDGLGIGLFISRSIIECHNGRLEAMANIGRGATFWFSMPGLGRIDLHAPLALRDDGMRSASQAKPASLVDARP